MKIIIIGLVIGVILAIIHEIIIHKRFKRINKVAKDCILSLKKLSKNCKLIDNIIN